MFLQQSCFPLFQNQVLKTEKEKEEQRHEEEIGETGEKHAKELQDLESNNNQKLMLEYEKYQELQVHTFRPDQNSLESHLHLRRTLYTSDGHCSPHKSYEILFPGKKFEDAGGLRKTVIGDGRKQRTIIGTADRIL